MDSIIKVLSGYSEMRGDSWGIVIAVFILAAFFGTVMMLAENISNQGKNQSGIAFTAGFLAFIIAAVIIFCLIVAVDAYRNFKL